MKQTILILMFAGLLVGCTSPRRNSLIDSLTGSDSVVVLHLDSRKPAKVEIFRCTVEKTLCGPIPPAEITLSFLHYPDCQRLSVGTRYLCAIRHDSGTGYTLIRSDMLEEGVKTNLHTYAWEAESSHAKELAKQIRRHNK
jgi:hypothetical protein